MVSINLVITFLLIVIMLGSLSVSSTIPILKQQQSFAQTIKKVFNDSDFATLYSSSDSYVDSKVNINLNCQKIITSKNNAYTFGRC
jgi:hypothetical protein